MTGAPNNVVDFAQAKKDAQPHWVGPVRCVGCQHEWAGVGPIGTLWIECPQCGFHKGHPKHPFSCANDESVYICDCGSEALTVIVSKDEMQILCMACGVRHTDNIFP